MEYRFTFDRAADLYGAVRSSYPDALFDDIADAADLGHDDAVLELGCGTGQATRGFLRQGLQVLALDPGAELLRVARESLSTFQGVQFVQSTFEDWDPQSARFKLVASAQAFHWIDPEVRFAKVARVLRPAGVLAVFGTVPVNLPADLFAEFRRIYTSCGMPLDVPPPESWYLPVGPIAGLFAEAGLFEEPAHRSYAWTRTFTATLYADYLRTRSDLRMIEADKRKMLIGSIASAIEASGGPFEMNYETHLYMARLAR